MQANLVAACAVGAVLGYITHYLIRRDERPGIADLGAIVAVIFGAGVLGVVGAGVATSWYLIGLGIGFFLYWVALLFGREAKDFDRRRLSLFPFLG